MQEGGEEDEEQGSENEGRTADKLKEVERRTVIASSDHLLQDKGQEGQDHFGHFNKKSDFIQKLGGNLENSFRIWIPYSSLIIHWICSHGDLRYSYAL